MNLDDLDSDLEVIHQQIMLASKPEDLFGADDVILPAKVLQEFLSKEYEKYKAQLDPASFSTLDDQEAAEEARKKLECLYLEGREKISRFHYGLLGYGTLRPHISNYFEMGGNRYYLGSKLLEGEYFNLYQGYLEREGIYLGEVLIKLARDQRSNHLMQREARALDLLHKEDVPQWKHLPLVLDRFETAGRVGLVIRKCYGLSLTEVRRRQAHLKGVDQKHVAWMLDRSFSCFGYVHRCGIVHGNLTPDQLIINDRLHNVSAYGWEVSIHNPALTGEKVELLVDSHNPYVSPEVRERGEIGPWSDIYSLGKIFIWLLGGDPATNSIPDCVEDSVKHFLMGMVKEEHSRRSADCWELYEEQCRIKDALWPRKFLHFDVS